MISGDILTPIAATDLPGTLPPGTTARNLSGFLNAASATYSALNLPTAGLSFISGSITLKQNAENFNFDDRYNSLLKRGNKIHFKYTDPDPSPGQLVTETYYPAIGTTYITSTQYDMKSSLNITTGCILALLNKLTPRDLGICLEIGSGISVSTAVQSLLGAAGVPTELIDSTSFDSLLSLPQLVEPLAVQTGQSILNTASRLTAQHGTFMAQDLNGIVKCLLWNDFDAKAKLFSKRARELQSYKRQSAFQQMTKTYIVNHEENIVCTESPDQTQDSTTGTLRTIVEINRDDAARVIQRTTREFTIEFDEPILKSKILETSVYEPIPAEAQSIVRTGQAQANGECFPIDRGRLLTKITETRIDNNEYLETWLASLNVANQSGGYPAINAPTAEDGDGGDGDFPQQILNDQISNYWTMDEVSGDRFDTPGSLTLTDTNTVGSQPGLKGNEAVFVRANDEYLINNSFTTPTGDFSISLWVSLNDLNFHTIVSQIIISAPPFEGAFVLEYNSNESTFQFTIETDPAGIPTAVKGNSVKRLVKTGVRYHLVATYNITTGDVCLYVNTQKTKNVHPGAGPLYPNSQPLIFGQDADFFTVRGLDGTIDEVGFWNRELTQTDVNQLYGGNGSEQSQGVDYSVVDSGLPIGGVNVIQTVTETWNYVSDNEYVHTIETSAPQGFAAPIWGNQTPGIDPATDPRVEFPVSPAAPDQPIQDQDPNKDTLIEVIRETYTRNDNTCEGWKLTRKKWTTGFLNDPEKVLTEVQDQTKIIQDVFDKSLTLIQVEHTTQNNVGEPSPETYPPAVNVGKNQITTVFGEALNQPIASQTFPFNVVNTVNLGSYTDFPLLQIKKIGQTTMDFDNGRILGMTMADSPFEMDLDCWIDFLPFFRCKIIEPYVRSTINTNINVASIFVADTPTITISPTETVVGWLGVFLGQQNDPAIIQNLSDFSFEKTDSIPDSSENVIVIPAVNLSANYSQETTVV